MIESCPKKLIFTAEKRLSNDNDVIGTCSNLHIYRRPTWTPEIIPNGAVYKAPYGWVSGVQLDSIEKSDSAGARKPVGEVSRRVLKKF